VLREFVKTLKQVFTQHAIRSHLKPALKLRMLEKVKQKWNHALPYIFMALFALSRWPGLFPPSFSAAYAVVFCAGVYFTKRINQWFLLGTMLLTDIALNFYYQNVKGWDVWTLSNLGHQSLVYVAWVVLFVLGRRFKPRSSFASLLGGGVLGALLFYVITNTASWLFNPFDNPEYHKNLTGLLIAIVKGTSGWPDAWMFFRNTLFSGGLFTALFVAAMKITAASESPLEKEAGVRASEPEAEPEAPEEAKA
jgi:uncharacterized protein DUF6580